MLKGHILHGVLLVFFLSACEAQNAKDPAQIYELDDISLCLTSESSDVFEIVTWNLERFPESGRLTADLVRQIIERQNPDIIAVQEIASKTEFELLAQSLEGYESQAYFRGSLSLGFLYKSSVITVEEAAMPILQGDNNAWPRAPLLFSVKHKNGIAVNLITLHLKCCEGEENFQRRLAASEQLKAYIDENLSDEPVIVLGDFNDEIFGIPNAKNPFLNFINDADNYLFADMEIAQGEVGVWSYPSWPSHIDHILISDELFDLKREILTLTLDNCIDDYDEGISDHRPIMLKLSK